jgi:uncharacterized protein
MPSLSDKLKSLGVKVGAQDLSPPLTTPPQQVSHLEQVLMGHSLENTQGETFVVENHYPLEYQQGRVGLLTTVELKMLSAWARDDRLAQLPLPSYAFLDTETTGLAGGTGTYAFLIGIARFENDEFHLAQFFMRDPIEEPAQLLALEEFLAPCQALVTFNGKTFDAPLLNTRYLYHGWRSPLLGLAHVDLLHLARRLWRDRLPSRTLGNLEIQILGSERTEEDIPGWAIPQMYFDYLRSGDPIPLKSVFYHNAMDVVSLAALFNHVAGLLANPVEAQIEHGVDLVALARLYEDLGEIDTAVALYLHGLDFEDHTNSTIAPEFRLSRTALLDAIQRLAMIHKRRENYQTAVSLWQKAASFQHIESHVELAKFYEHHLRDNQEALSWTKSALDVVNSENFPRYDRLRWQPELETRIERLMRKVRGGEGH